ncbi:MAG: Platelet-activating factor acetylhydrolase plasma/intracellular isoform [Pedosphaera sp.]|nr:Platelet-activating factor acetylhydrolase plasma/intracellular isoform [Pedosphaera sp.]
MPVLRYKDAAGPSSVATLKLDWQDQKRDRKVPVKIYYPKTGAGPFPVIIFSHGLGGSRDGYEYLGQHWASHAYVSVHVQHVGSDSAVWQDAAPAERFKALQKSASNLKNATERPRDVSFAIDQLVKLNQEEGPLRRQLDLVHIGVAGHSFGSFTTLAIAGEVLPALSGGEFSAGDPRVKAAIAMSSPVPRDKSRWDAAFAKIHIPCFHMTGTRDDSPIGDTKAEARRVPFDHISGADQFLLTLQDGDHMVFSGRSRGQGGGEKDELFHGLILMSSTAFWDAYLKGDAQAKAWLAGNGFATLLKQDGKFEQKLH